MSHRIRPRRAGSTLALVGLVLLTAPAGLAHWGVPEPPRPASERMYPAARHGGNYMHNFYLPPAPSSTPWAPSWAPDGYAIAISMAGSIWTVDPDSGIAREVTANDTYDSSPDWSPDGRWIVYTADDGGQTIQLEILDLRTGRVRRLTDDEQIYADPVFSPAGDRLAYVSTRPNGYFNVYIRPIHNGRWAGPAIAVTEDHEYRSNRLYFGPWDMHITPEWTRDGTELLLVSNRNVPLGSGHLFRVPARAGGMAQAVEILAEQTLYRTRPDVSIDGKRLVYSSTRGAADQYSNLYVLPVAGGEPYKMTFFTHDAFHPRWSPDGEWIAYISNEHGVSSLELLETYGGERRTVEIRQRRWKRPTGVLEVRTTDASTGETMPARIHLTASDGKFYAPPDTYARISQGGREHLFHQMGTFRLDVPAGPLSLDAVRGFEYWPAHASVEIRPDEVSMLTIPLERMTDMGAKGWYSGSTHMHMNYGGNLHNTLENLLMMSAAEDQDIANELVANKDNRVLDYQYFIPGRKAHPVSWVDRLLLVSQEYRPPFYGHVFLLGLADHLISPWATGYEGTAIESLYPSNTDILRKARQQDATTGYVHSFFGENDPIESHLGQGKGFMVDAALGTTDAIEWSFSWHAPFYPWYAVLNNGLRIAATGGEDSMSDLHISKLVGSARTYVYTGDAGLATDPWLQGIREGRTFVSTGPLLDLRVDGHRPGEEIRLPAGGGTVDVSLWMRSITPISTLMLIVDGEIVEQLPMHPDRHGADVRTSIPITRSGWLHVRAEGTREESFPLDTGYAQAFTSPIWITVGDAPPRDLDSAMYSIRWIDRLQELAEAHPGWRSAWEKSHVLAQFEEARQIYRRFAMEASERDAPSVARRFRRATITAARDSGAPRRAR